MSTFKKRTSKKFRTSKTFQEKAEGLGSGDGKGERVGSSCEEGGPCEGEDTNEKKRAIKWIRKIYTNFRINILRIVIVARFLGGNFGVALKLT